MLPLKGMIACYVWAWNSVVIHARHDPQKLVGEAQHAGMCREQRHLLSHSSRSEDEDAPVMWWRVGSRWPTPFRVVRHSPQHGDTYEPSHDDVPKPKPQIHAKPGGGCLWDRRVRVRAKPTTVSTQFPFAFWVQRVVPSKCSYDTVEFCTWSHLSRGGQCAHSWKVVLLSRRAAQARPQDLRRPRMPFPTTSAWFLHGCSPEGVVVDESLLETMRVKPLFRPWSLSATACVKDLLRYRLIAVSYLPFMSTIQFWRCDLIPVAE